MKYYKRCFWYYIAKYGKSLKDDPVCKCHSCSGYNKACSKYRGTEKSERGITILKKER